jgi:hypothetical protein
VAEFDLTRQTRPARPDSNSTRSDFLGIFKKVKLTRPDPNPTWSDPPRDQMTFNPIKIYQRSEKTQYVNWPDPTWPWPDSARPDFFQKVKLTRSARPEPKSDPTRPITTSNLSHYILQVYNSVRLTTWTNCLLLISFKSTYVYYSIGRNIFPRPSKLPYTI